MNRSVEHILNSRLAVVGRCSAPIRMLTVDDRTLLHAGIEALTGTHRGEDESEAHRGF